MKLVVGILAAIAAVNASTCADCTATCNTDQTLTITIPYHRTASILSLEYGTCNSTSVGVRGADSQNATDNSFEVILDMAACDMDSKLRTLEYNQTVTNIRIGVDSDGAELEFSRYEFDSWCSYNDTYEIVFNYGTLSTDGQTFNETGGEIGYKFEIKACAEATCANFTDEYSKKGGETITLAIQTTSDHWDSDTKKFAPVDCTVKDTDNDLTYILFSTGSADECNNTDVAFDIEYSNGKWIFSHILFLLGSYESSTFQLVCNVVVCDATQTDSKCNGIAGFCGTSY